MITYAINSWFFPATFLSCNGATGLEHHAANEAQSQIWNYDASNAVSRGHMQESRFNALLNVIKCPLSIAVFCFAPAISADLEELISRQWHLVILGWVWQLLLVFFTASMAAGLQWRAVAEIVWTLKPFSCLFAVIVRHESFQRV